MTLKFPMLHTDVNVSVEESSVGRRKARNRKQKPAAVEQPLADAQTEVQGEKKEADPNASPILMVEVENIVHDKFRQTEEVKVSY